MLKVKINWSLCSVLGVLLIVGCSDGSGDSTGGMLSTGGSLLVDQSGGGDFASIQAAVNASTAGTTIQVGPGIFEEQVVVEKNVRIAGSGSATVLRMPGPASAFPEESSDDSSAVMVVRNVQGAVIENLSFSGPQDGLQIRDSSAITVRNVDATANGDDGIDVRNSRDVSVTGRFNGNGDKGVQVRDGSNGVSVDASELRNNGGKGIRIRESSNCSISNSDVFANGDDGITVRDTSGVTVVGNTVSDNSGYGIRVRNSPDTLVDGNSVSGNADGDLRQD